MTEPLIPKQTTIVDDALENFTSFWKNKNSAIGIATPFLTQIQKNEDQAYAFFQAFWPTLAQGAQLDAVGYVVGISRNGRSDSEFRQQIFAKIAINTSRGTPENTIEIFKLLTGSTDVMLFEYFPGSVEIYGNVNFEFRLIYDGPEAFAFADSLDGLGFGDLFDSTVGGGFAELVILDVPLLYDTMDSVLSGGVRLQALGYYDQVPRFSFEGDSEGAGFSGVYDPEIGGGFAGISPDS